ncbi:MAG: hypothetical protein RL341_505 [Pseudomonadota bacterium]|jgi:hypothetical protein
MTYAFINRTALAGAALALTGVLTCTPALAQKAAPAQPATAASSTPVCADCGTVIGVTSRNRADYNPKMVWLVGRSWQPTVYFFIDADSHNAPKHDVIVKMDDGTVVSFAFSVLPGWEAGERVRVENGTLAGR